jgi:hypothetical protein
LEELRFYRASGEYGFLSNLYKRELVFEGKKFKTSEHAYQYGKFAKKEVAEWAMEAPSPHLVAILAHGLFRWDVTPSWSQIKVDRMKSVLKEKFIQHEDLKNKLLETGNKFLIEESNIDAYWGIGKNGKGKNMLGLLLMEIREELKSI